MSRPIRLLIVDDSAVVRSALSSVLGNLRDIEIMATAADPFAAARHIQKELPDVVLLDVEMPKMDGLTFLKKIMDQRPLPVVVCSNLTQSGGEVALRALELGAVEVIAKPNIGSPEALSESRQLLSDVIRAASRARLGARRRESEVQPKLTADAVVAAPLHNAKVERTEAVILIGASTGGTEALASILSALPADTPGVVIVQHMPEKFTTSFAGRLDSLSPMIVREASHGDSVVRGRALLAPGNKHLLLCRSGTSYFVQLRDGPLVSRHRPSVDVLFRTGARYAGSNAIGIILTGMGDDGARGMAELKAAGATTIAQDERTCVVFGMPQEAIKRGAVDHVLPLGGIANAIERLV